MYIYAHDASIKANRPIQASIGCPCGAKGIVVSGMPLAAISFNPVSLFDNRIRIRCACLICSRQGVVTCDISDLTDVDEDDIRSLKERCADYLFMEKRCEHHEDICLSASLHNDQWSHIYTASPCVHIVYCAKCRKRGPMQLPIGLSRYVDAVMNHE